MDINTSLEVLSITTHTLTTPCTLKEALESITEMTSKLMETRQAAVLMQDEDQEELIIKSCVGFPPETGTRVGYPLELPPRLKNILWRVRTIRRIGWIDAGLQGLGFPLLVIPLRIKGQKIGLLVTGEPIAADGGFDARKKQLFITIASLASLVIENAKVYDYLRQQFAQRSYDLMEANRRESGDNDEMHHLMAKSLSNPDKVVRLLASSFYKELHRAGFTPGQITMAASRILECITTEEEKH
ncbi:MAG: hypothetical protein ACOCQP_03375 [Lentisphaeria bacterium]